MSKDTGFDSDQWHFFKDLEKLNRRRTRSNYEPSFLTEEGIQRSETYIEESEEYKQYCRYTFGYHD